MAATSGAPPSSLPLTQGKWGTCAGYALGTAISEGLFGKYDVCIKPEKIVDMLKQQPETSQVWTGMHIKDICLAWNKIMEQPHTWIEDPENEHRYKFKVSSSTKSNIDVEHISIDVAYNRLKYFEKAAINILTHIKLNHGTHGEHAVSAFKTYDTAPQMKAVNSWGANDQPTIFVSRENCRHCIFVNVIITGKQRMEYDSTVPVEVHEQIPGTTLSWKEAITAWDNHSRTDTLMVSYGGASSEVSPNADEEVVLAPVKQQGLAIASSEVIQYHVDEGEKELQQSWSGRQRSAALKVKAKTDAEAKRKAEAEAMKKANEERQRLEVDAKRKSEVEQKRLDAELKAKTDVEAKRKAQVDAMKKANEEGMRLEAEAKRKAEVHDNVLAEVERDGLALERASNVMQGDREIVFAAVNQNGYALQYASNVLKGDRDIVYAAMRQNSVALKFASNVLQRDKDFVMQAMAQNGMALKFASETLKCDKEIVKAAVTNNGMALQYASLGPRDDMEIVLAAIRNNGAALQYASTTIQNSNVIKSDASAQIDLDRIQRERR